MTSTQLRPKDDGRPLVAVWCSVPLLGEAVEFALEFAEVRSFAPSRGDLAGLLRWLRPDAVVVDSDERTPVLLRPQWGCGHAICVAATDASSSPNAVR